MYLSLLLVYLVIVLIRESVFFGLKIFWWKENVDFFVRGIDFNFRCVVEVRVECLFFFLN